MAEYLNGDEIQETQENAGGGALQPVEDHAFAPLPTEEFGPQTLVKAEERRKIHEGLKLLAIRSTNPEDWVMMGGKPYLTESGCMKFAQIYGVSFRDLQVNAVHYTDEEGPVIEFFATVTAIFQNRFDVESGSAATSEKFFNRVDPETKKVIRLPLSEINRPNVRKKAITSARARATRKILGLSFSKEEVIKALKEAGKDPSRIPGVTYGERHEKSRSTGKGILNETKKKIANMVFEMAGEDKELAQNMLESYSEFTAKDGTHIKGVRKVTELSDKRAQAVYGRVKKEYQQFLSEQKPSVPAEPENVEPREEAF